MFSYISTYSSTPHGQTEQIIFHTTAFQVFENGFIHTPTPSLASLVAQMVKASAYNVGDPGLIPVSGGSPGEGNGTLLQYSCLENPMDSGAWELESMGSQRDRTEQLHFHFSHPLCSGQFFMSHDFDFFTLLSSEYNSNYSLQSGLQHQPEHHRINLDLDLIIYLR